MNPPQITEAEYLRQLMSSSAPHSCTNCTGMFFKQVFTIRSVSKLFTGQLEDSLVPLPMWRCDDCGTPVEKLKLPEATKETPKSSIITE